MGKWGFFKGNRENWFSHPIYNWFDSSVIEPSKVLADRVNPLLLRKALEDCTGMMLLDISFYPDGTYQEEGRPLLSNLSAFYKIHIKEMISGRHVGDINVFLPCRWNKRFMGICGAGTNLETDWDKEQTSSLTTWPMAVRNGYACAISTGATGEFLDASWGFLDGDLDWELIRHWAFYGTHTMTVAAKKIVEAAYGEPIYKSYMHGTSGGGRQVLLEAQRFPDDYDGLWADGPLYDYYNLMFSCLWAPLVYYNEEHKVPIEKYKAAKELALKMGCASRVSFDYHSVCWLDYLKALEGWDSPAGPITKEDIRVMEKVWNGPTRVDGTQITYGFGPEITQWPVGPRKFGYLRIKENGQPAIIPFALQWMRWLVRDPEWKLSDCSYKEFDRIYREHRLEFEDYGFYEPDIRAFAARGGKLIITHGTGDHITPNRLTYDYYKKVWNCFNSEKEMNESFRVFFPPHGGHALYDWDGPIVTNAAGMLALTAWVEEDRAPESIDTLKYDFEKEEVVERSQVPVFYLWNWKEFYEKHMDSVQFTQLLFTICDSIINE